MTETERAEINETEKELMLQVAKDFCIRVNFGDRIRYAMEPADYANFLNQLATEIAARVQAAAVEMRERCAKATLESHFGIYDTILSIPTPHDALDEAVRAARLDEAQWWYYNNPVGNQFRSNKEADERISALTQPKPAESAKESRP